MPVTRKTRTLVLPLDLAAEIQLTVPEAMTPDQWERFLTLLAAMRPGLVSEVVDATIIEPLPPDGDRVGGADGWRE